MYVFFNSVYTNVGRVLFADGLQRETTNRTYVRTNAGKEGAQSVCRVFEFLCF